MLRTLALLCAPAFLVAQASFANETRPSLDGVSESDWASIRAAYEANRHGVFAVDGAHETRHPHQGWTTTFDGCGFTTRPDGGGWEWGLELVRYGFADGEHEVTVRACASADGRRVAYAWDDALTEWWINDARGLEHGYTLHERPRGEGTLSFTLRVRGALRGDVLPDGLGVSFAQGAGGSVLTYAGLWVHDADGRTLDAGIEVVPEGIRILVDERGARYPLTIDPVAQQAYLKASNTDAVDIFGFAIAMSGDTVVVGAYSEASNASGVNGNQADNSADNAGAAYVFVRSGATWSQQAYLKASNTAASDHFGYTVGISGDTVIVGAYVEASNATGVNGDQTNNSAGQSGAAYVFVRSGTTWSQQAYLKASNTGSVDHFGWSVAISGNTAVVGAEWEDSNVTGVNGDQTNNSATDAGAAYVFVRSGTTWSQQAYLKASNTGIADRFGGSVAIDADTIVVGTGFEDSDASGVNGNQASDSASAAGAAYVFVRSGTVWGQQAYLKASNTAATDSFGGAVAIAGDTVVVGAVGEDSNATTVNGDQANNSSADSGAAYVFVRSGAVWSQQAYLKASNADAADNFGNAVAISGEMAVIGALAESSTATGTSGNQADNSASNAGAAYAFARSGSVWSQLAYLKASNTGVFDHFGQSVAISGSTVAVGARFEDSNATVVNGNQANETANNAGAAYVFVVYPEPLPLCFGDGSTTLCPCSPAPVPNGGAGRGCPNNLFPSGARLAASGIASIASDTLLLQATDMINGGGCLIFQGDSPTFGGAGQVFGDGKRCVTTNVRRMLVKTVVGFAAQYPGMGDTSVSTRGAVVMPSLKYYQGWYRSANPSFCTPELFNLTNAVAVLWSP